MCGFYGDKSICLFDTLKIASDNSNISQNQPLKKIHQNIIKILEGFFSNFTIKGIFHYLSINELSKE